MGYLGVRHPLVYDNFDEAEAKYLKVMNLGKVDSRIQMKPHPFDRATVFSMYWNQSIRGRRLWKWQNEASWLKRKKEGTELSTDISGDENSDDETPSSSSANASSAHATSPTFAPTSRANQSGLSRSQISKEKPQDKSEEKQ